MTLAASAALALLFGGVTFGQHGAGGAVTSTVRRGDMITVTTRAADMGLPLAGPAIEQAPYSAQVVMEHAQALADGTHVVRQLRTTRVFRDSEGRTRTERPVMTGPNAPANGPTLIQINDPVAGFRYTLDTQNHVAHRIATASRVLGPAGGEVQSCEASAANGTPANRHVSAKSLGTQTMEGVTVQGCFTTRTVPVGAQGNDRPLVYTSEIWWSPELSVVMLSKNSDPRSGETIMRRTNIVVGEPDAALFHPPADYTIVDDDDSSTITFKVPPAGK